MPVRPLSEGDIPEVAALYWNYMRRREGAAPPVLLAFLRELFFTNPFCDSANPSLVYETNGKVVGFLGVSVRKMSVCGEPIRVMFGGNLVVHPKFRSGLAVARLVNHFLASEYDLSVTDSANEITRRILQRMGYPLVPALNIHWGRPLRPLQYGVHAMFRSKGTVDSSVRFAAKPICSVADGLSARLAISPFRQAESRLHGTPLDVETLLECLVEFRKGYSLWTEYDVDTLQWLLNFMERRPSRGTLRKIVLRNDAQKIVGWYIYYVKPGAVGEVVQIGGEPTSTKDVLDHLFHDAWQQGVIGVHGMVDTRRMPDYSDKGCFFTCRGGWTITNPRKPGLLELLERGDAFFSRLDGEWALDPGD
jgi:hypothetical protein